MFSYKRLIVVNVLNKEADQQRQLYGTIRCDTRRESHVAWYAVRDVWNWICVKNIYLIWGKWEIMKEYVAILQIYVINPSVPDLLKHSSALSNSPNSITEEKKKTFYDRRKKQRHSFHFTQLLKSVTMTILVLHFNLCFFSFDLCLLQYPVLARLMTFTKSFRSISEQVLKRDHKDQS